MPLTELDHYFVRANDLERTRRFYCDVLGFEVMPRPDFPFPGYWLGVAGKGRRQRELRRDAARHGSGRLTAAHAAAGVVLGSATSPTLPRASSRSGPAPVPPPRR